MAIAFFMTPALLVAEEKAPQPMEDTAAIVNGEIIPKGRLDRELSGFQARIIRSGKVLDEQTLVRLRGTILEKLINQALLYQVSVKEGITVDDAEVEKQWATIREKLGSGEELKAVLSRIHVTEEIIKEEIRQVEAVRKFVKEKFEKGAAVSDEEAGTYYKSHPESFTRPEQVRARHILLQPDMDGGDQAKENAKRQLEELKKEIEGGADFGDLASKHSKCPSSQRGGDLGFFERGRMAKPFEDAAFALKPGELSDIVVTKFGYHLIKLEERRPPKLLPFDDVKEKLTEHLRREKVKEALGSYLKQLRQESQIERFGGTEKKNG
jgi:peptidyl-prolyl cis-trans isomerase C